MKAREMFKDVESYNRIAPLMFTDCAKINLYDCGLHLTVASFESYADFSKYIKREYADEVAKQILNYDNWTFDEPVKFTWHPYWGWNTEITEYVEYSLDLVRKY